MTTLALRRIAFKVPPRPSARTVYRSLRVGNALAWIGAIVSRLPQGSTVDIVLNAVTLVVWLVIYRLTGEINRKEEHLERRRGLPLAVSRWDWIALGFCWLTIPCYLLGR